jgi:hypothetical protein
MTWKLGFENQDSRNDLADLPGAAMLGELLDQRRMDQRAGVRRGLY